MLKRSVIYKLKEVIENYKTMENGVKMKVTGKVSKTNWDSGNFVKI